MEALLNDWNRKRKPASLVNSFDISVSVGSRQGRKIGSHVRGKFGVASRAMADIDLRGKIERHARPTLAIECRMSEFLHFYGNVALHADHFTSLIEDRSTY